MQGEAEYRIDPVYAPQTLAVETVLFPENEQDHQNDGQHASADHDYTKPKVICHDLCLVRTVTITNIAGCMTLPVLPPAPKHEADGGSDQCQPSQRETEFPGGARHGQTWFSVALWNFEVDQVRRSGAPVPAINQDVPSCRGRSWPASGPKCQTLRRTNRTQEREVLGASRRTRSALTNRRWLCMGQRIRPLPHAATPCIAQASIFVRRKFGDSPPDQCSQRSARE